MRHEISALVFRHAVAERRREVLRDLIHAAVFVDHLFEQPPENLVVGRGGPLLVLLQKDAAREKAQMRQKAIVGEGILVVFDPEPFPHDVENGADHPERVARLLRRLVVRVHEMERDEGRLIFRQLHAETLFDDFEGLLADLVLFRIQPPDLPEGVHEFHVRRAAERERYMLDEREVDLVVEPRQLPAGHADDLVAHLRMIGGYAVDDGHEPLGDALVHRAENAHGARHFHRVARPPAESDALADEHAVPARIALGERHIVVVDLLYFQSVIPAPMQKK